MAIQTRLRRDRTCCSFLDNFCCVIWGIPKSTMESHRSLGPGYGRFPIADGAAKAGRARDVTPCGVGTPEAVQTMMSGKRWCSGLEKQMAESPCRRFSGGQKPHLADHHRHVRNRRNRRHSGRTHFDDDANRAIFECRPDRFRRRVAAINGRLAMYSGGGLRRKRTLAEAVDAVSVPERHNNLDRHGEQGPP